MTEREVRSGVARCPASTRRTRRSPMTHTEGGTPFDVAEQGLLRMLEHRAVHGELADSSQLIDAALAAARLAGHADISAAQRRSMGWLLAALAEQTARAQRLNGPAVLLHQALVAADDETLATVLAWRVACSGLDGALAALLCVDHLPPDGAVTIVRTGLAAG